MSNSEATIAGARQRWEGASRDISESRCAELLAADLAHEMAERWRRGERVPAEALLVRNALVSQHPEAAARLIYEELCLRQEAGLEVSPADYFRRFPQWKTEVGMLLECHQLLEPEHFRFPEIGHVLGGFKLLAELGRGATSRVYLATQPLLASRLVVLKVSAHSGEEHLLLSSLQHTNIVPLYCIQDDPQRELRAFCMPYLGGTTLDRILAEVRPGAGSAHSGQQILDALDRARTPHTATSAFSGPARRLLERYSYAEAICWFGAGLADALAYVHERGLVHLDLKPSNVLVAADGQPMLIDFHLSREPIHTGETVQGTFGGTPHYMSPEQSAAMQVAGTTAAAPADVDGRSDIYSLALVLYEALGGEPNSQTGSRRRLDQVDPKLGPGLANIIERCLDPASHRRYPNARSLAEDLRRHLADLPLRGVRNLLTERWRKWRRRQPSGLAIATMLLVVLAASASALLIGAMHVGQQRRQAEQALIESDRWLAVGDQVEAARVLKVGIAAVEYLPAAGDLRDRLQYALVEVRQAQVAKELSAVVDRLRIVYGAAPAGPSQDEALTAACRALWQRRSELVRPVVGQARNARTPASQDILELAVLWANLRFRGGEGVAARQEALEILTQAEQLLGLSPVLQFERQRYSHAPDRVVDVETASRWSHEVVARTPWEHWAVGRGLLDCGHEELALGHLRTASEQAPDLLWPHYYMAHCSYRLGRQQEALSAAQVCVALGPRRAECYDLRGLVHAALGDSVAAKRDFEKALSLDPTFAAAAQHRASVAAP